MKRCKSMHIRQTYYYCRDPTGRDDHSSKPMGWPIAQNKSVKCMDAHGNYEEERGILPDLSQ